MTPPANEIADLAEKVGADVQEIARGAFACVSGHKENNESDQRISPLGHSIARLILVDCAPVCIHTHR